MLDLSIGDENYGDLIYDLEFGNELERLKDVMRLTLRSSKWWTRAPRNYCHRGLY